MQLHQYEEARAEFAAAGIAVHAITGEPGGSAALHERLLEKKLAPLSFELHSDPEHALMLEPKAEMYVCEPMPPKLVEMGLPEYEMYQPALLVVSPAGEVLWWWSWKKLQAGPLIEGAAAVPGAGYGNSRDVRWRPQPSVLLPILASSDEKDLGERLEAELKKVVDNVGFPGGDDMTDHVNVAKVVPMFDEPATEEEPSAVAPAAPEAAATVASASAATTTTTTTTTTTANGCTTTTTTTTTTA
eukprot:SAG31_NODE_7009_length_1820_cov_6.134224_2_plen_244_part_00